MRGMISDKICQWMFGSGSLLPVRATIRAQFRHKRQFKRVRDTLAPTYGKLLFSKPCRAVPVADKCRAAILAAEDGKGRLNPVLADELTRLFESDAMLQVQTDTYITLLDKVRLDLLRVFPAGPMTMRKVRWAIDTRVQQGYLPGAEDLVRGRLLRREPDRVQRARRGQGEQRQRGSGKLAQAEAMRGPAVECDRAEIGKG